MSFRVPDVSAIVVAALFAVDAVVVFVANVSVVQALLSFLLLVRLVIIAIVVAVAAFAHSATMDIVVCGVLAIQTTTGLCKDLLSKTTHTLPCFLRFL